VRQAWQVEKGVRARRQAEFPPTSIIIPFRLDATSLRRAAFEGYAIVDGVCHMAADTDYLLPRHASPRYCFILRCYSPCAYAFARDADVMPLFVSRDGDMLMRDDVVYAALL